MDASRFVQATAAIHLCFGPDAHKSRRRIQGRCRRRNGVEDPNLSIGVVVVRPLGVAVAGGDEADSTKWAPGAMLGCSVADDLKASFHDRIVGPGTHRTSVTSEDRASIRAGHIND